MLDLPRSTDAVRFDAVTAGYGQGPPVLTDLELHVSAPSTIALRGPNGCGKSTMLELASGYLRPRSGTVSILGASASSPSARAERRVVRSTISLFPEMSVHDHLVFASRLRGTDPAVALARVDAYGLTPWLHARTKALSNGNRRKTWLIMTTLGSASVYWLDEPFQGLDDAGVEVLCHEIREWSRHAATIVTSHEWPHAFAPDTEVLLTVPAMSP